MTKQLRLALAAAAMILALPLAAQALKLAPQPESSLADRVSERALRWGDRGDAVAGLQRLLQEAGFDPGPVDGVFGPLTAGAVRAVQRQYNLEVDGLFGRQTLAAVTASPAAEAPAQTAGATGEEANPAVQSLVFHTADVIPGDTRPSPPKTAGEEGFFALTFNGAPGPDLLPAVLSALDQHRMKATFFIQGEMAALRPDLVARIAEAGHELGNAGYQSFDMTRLTASMMRAQLRQSQKAIEEASGQTPRFFRPPLGRSSLTLLTTAAANMLDTSMWTNVAVTDPTEVGPAELASRLAGTIYPGAVVMIHQDRRSTVDALEMMLRHAARQGYLSLTLSDLSDSQRAARAE